MVRETRTKAIGINIINGLFFCAESCDPTIMQRHNNVYLNFIWLYIDLLYKIYSAINVIIPLCQQAILQ